MNKKKSKGIILIILSLIIFAGFLIIEYSGWFLDSGSKENDEATAAPTLVISSHTYHPNVIQDVDGDTYLSKTNIKVSKEILKAMKISKAEFDKQVITIANSNGYAASEQMVVMDEYTVNNANHTVTVTCYFKQGTKENYFDLIYQTKTKYWQFKPY